MDSSDLRAEPRYRANAAYTRVVVRPSGGSVTEPKPGSEQEGHAYDISARGVRFELDDAMPTGTPISFEIDLPGCRTPVRGKGRVVRVFSGEDDPGPRRMAAHIEEFASEHDRVRLAEHLEDHWLPLQL